MLSSPSDRAVAGHRPQASELAVRVTNRRRPRSRAADRKRRQLRIPHQLREHADVDPQHAQLRRRPRPDIGDGFVRLTRFVLQDRGQPALDAIEARIGRGRRRQRWNRKER